MNFSPVFEAYATRAARLAGASLLTAVLAACNSSVKLEDTPVADRSGSDIPVATGDAAAGLGQRGIVGVKTDDLKAGQGPANVGRVVYFDFDSFTVRPEFGDLIDGHAKFLNGNRSRRVQLEGHTDERGGREYNLALGQKRAEAVRRALAISGVSDNQMEAVSYGEEKPAASGHDEKSWAKNRRAELNYR